MFLENIKVALRALTANKLRSMLTTLGIIIGVTSVIALMSLGNGVQGFITSQFEGQGSNLVFIFPARIETGAAQIALDFSLWSGRALRHCAVADAGRCRCHACGPACCRMRDVVAPVRYRQRQSDQWRLASTMCAFAAQCRSIDHLAKRRCSLAHYIDRSRS